MNRLILGYNWKLLKFHSFPIYNFCNFLSSTFCGEPDASRHESDIFRTFGMLIYKELQSFCATYLTQSLQGGRHFGIFATDLTQASIEKYSSYGN